VISIHITRRFLVVIFRFISGFFVAHVVRVDSRRLLADFDWVDLLSGHAILFVGPTAEIDQLAALGTERTPGILLPLNLLSALRTLWHKAKV